MADKTLEEAKEKFVPLRPPSPVPPPPMNVGKLVLEPLNHGLAASLRMALKLGVPVHEVLELLFNHLASAVAMIEPPGARAGAIQQVVSEFAGMVKKHVDARNMTEGGIILPNGGVQ